MEPVSFSQYEQYVQSFDKRYERIAVVTSKYADDVPEILCCWRLTIWERIKLLFNGRILVHILDTSLPPHKISLDFEHLREIENYYQKTIEEIHRSDESDRPQTETDTI